MLTQVSSLAKMDSAWDLFVHASETFGLATSKVSQPLQPAKLEAESVIA